jgi:hypothetical protein
LKFQNILLECISNPQLHLPTRSQLVNRVRCGRYGEGVEVTLHIKEAYNWSDILAENLGTQSGDKLLVTAGMVQIEASYNGKPIEAQKDYMLMMPSKTKQENGMQLFTGTREDNSSSSMNWVLPKNNNYASILNQKIYPHKEQDWKHVLKSWRTLVVVVKCSNGRAICIF